MHDDAYDKIMAHPKFQELVSKRTRFAWTLSLIVLVVFYTFVMVVAFTPDILAVPLAEGTTTTWGIPVGAAIIIFSWLTTGIYVRRANTEFDRLNREILEEVQSCV
jgi:uncharacterized membrane protein (DUF485 family)